MLAFCEYGNSFWLNLVEKVKAKKIDLIHH